MSNKAGSYQIPFDKSGSMQHYPEPWYEGAYPDHKSVGPEWRDNTPRDLILKFSGYRRGRSAAYFLFEDAAGKSYPVFLKEFEEIVLHMSHGEVRGSWVGIKRGLNYGLRRVGGV